MEWNTLKPLSKTYTNKRVIRKHDQLVRLLNAIQVHTIPEVVQTQINYQVDQVNAALDRPETFKKVLHVAYKEVYKLATVQCKLVPKNLHQTTWMSLGMSVFGVPIGIAFSAATDNYGLLAIGLPIGMVIGIAVGSGMDKKAAKTGKQLDFKLG